MHSQLESREEERRRRRRALIRAHHPDRGGNTAEFVRLLQQLDQERPVGDINPEMKFGRRRRWWQVVLPSMPPVRRPRRRQRRVV